MEPCVDKQNQLRLWAQGLREASRNRDWQAVARLDAELAAALRQWPSLAGWNPAERQALDLLKQVHTQVREFCAAEMRNLGETLELMRQGRDRWQAYAESTGWDGSAGDDEEQQHLPGARA